MSNVNSDHNKERPRGVGKTCRDCKWYIDDHYCDFTCWYVHPVAIIPECGCMVYQAHLGNFEQKDNTATEDRSVND